ncbi:intermembrane transport protein PqiB [Rhodopila sp.]|uniref:PqiB family protein n=1 Tax=Rhodopila sp. TaxID=2480087 RepID=UPI003D0A27D6
MSDSDQQPADRHDDQKSPPEATTHRTRFSVIWIIPIVALAIAAWLGWQGLSRRGPEVTIEFDTADGLTAGQTQVKQKSVGLGTVQSVVLSKDLKQVEVHVQMNAQAAPLLTDHAKFWVVRPRLNGINISGLETLLSGAFIAIDPGAPGGRPATRFKGLEAPPDVRSDEPGRSYTLMTDSIGAIGQGAPVFFRNVVVGEVLGYTIPAGGIGLIPVKVFVREPYDHDIRQDTRFWDVSGVQVEVGPSGFHLQIQSLQAVLSGGVAFGLPPQRRENPAPEATDNANFKLFASKGDADLAGYREQTKFVTYLRGSVQGLAVGSPVDMFGFQIGNVTGIQLAVDPRRGQAQVRVSMVVQPERFLSEDQITQNPPLTSVQAMVNNGMRAETNTSSLLTGASMMSMTFVPNAAPVKVTTEGDEIVLPSQSGTGLVGIEDALSGLSTKLSSMPLDQIGQNLNSLLSHADSTVNDPDLKQALHELNQSMQSVQHLVAQTNRGAGPLMQRLPEMSRQLQQTIAHANEALNSYSGDSNFHRDLDQALEQLNETATSLRTLADFLKRHPSSLLFGRNGP